MWPFIHHSAPAAVILTIRQVYATTFCSTVTNISISERYTFSLNTTYSLQYCKSYLWTVMRDLNWTDLYNSNVLGFHYIGTQFKLRKRYVLSSVRSFMFFFSISLSEYQKRCYVCPLSNHTNSSHTIIFLFHLMVYNLCTWRSIRNEYQSITQ